ncbi:hypothetical protein J21TS7_51860 [Paenibacillus cineris]|uniref:Uncharacterized protein n=1 Tax=Paenibacillus cineris TaxID=237530 RepID=A0ABQ4LK16_9BACL|nr:hypothetical protein J21TS7_51860 [Paenibacillus cineris]GIO64098.1 hypothetical protein J43TS9_56720 [Paenibacillus cineris]
MGDAKLCFGPLLVTPIKKSNEANGHDESTGGRQRGECLEIPACLASNLVYGDTVHGFLCVDRLVA